MRDVTDYSTVSHYPLPPSDIDEAAFLSDSYACEAPGCGQSPDADVHRAQPEGGALAVTPADFGDVD